MDPLLAVANCFQQELMFGLRKEVFDKQPRKVCSYKDGFVDVFFPCFYSHTFITMWESKLEERGFIYLPCFYSNPIHCILQFDITDCDIGYTCFCLITS